MKTRIPFRKIILLFLGPVGIFPIAAVTAWGICSYYVLPDVSGEAEYALFLQGSSDMGGGYIFTVTVALYAILGLTASLYLIERLPYKEKRNSFVRDLRSAAVIMSFHYFLFFFLQSGLLLSDYDLRIGPNDFRNMFALALILYTLSVIWIVLVSRRISNPWARRMLAPLLIVIWIAVGSDGNTWRAGQVVQSHQNPERKIRGFRHGIMMKWHDVCDIYFEGTPYSP